MFYFAHGDEVHTAAETSSISPAVFIALGILAFIVAIAAGIAIAKKRSAKPSDKADTTPDN